MLGMIRFGGPVDYAMDIAIAVLALAIVSRASNRT